VSFEDLTKYNTIVQSQSKKIFPSYNITRYIHYIYALSTKHTISILSKMVLCNGLFFKNIIMIIFIIIIIIIIIIVIIDISIIK